MSEQIKKYFEINAPCLSVRGIELRAEVPPKTLDHFLKGRRALNEEATQKIEKALNGLAFKVKKTAKRKPTK